MRRLLVLGLLLLLTGCGIPDEEQPRTLDPAQAPFNVFERNVEAPSGPGRVPLYFVRDDLVVLTIRPVERSTSNEDLLDLLLQGPTPEQIEKGTGTALPASFRIEDVEVGVNGVAVVTLGEGTTQNTKPLGYAQIVATLTASERARAVRFRADGVDLQVPRGDGRLSFGPFTREDYKELLAPELLATPSPVPTPAASPTP